MYSFRLSLWAERGIILSPESCRASAFIASSGKFGWNKRRPCSHVYSDLVGYTVHVRWNHIINSEMIMSKERWIACRQMWQVQRVPSYSHLTAPLTGEDWLQQHQKSHFGSINGYFLLCDEAKNRKWTKKGCRWVQTWSPSIYSSTGSFIFLENHQKCEA